MKISSNRFALAGGGAALLTSTVLYAAEPASMAKPAIQPSVIKAPVVAPKPVVPPTIAKPVVAQPVTPMPVKPVAMPNSTVPLSPVSPKLPATPVAGVIDVQRQTEKDARQDRQFSNQGKPLSLDAKAAKLKRDDESIRQGMDESASKADTVMTSAVTGLVMGTVSGAQQIGGGVAAEADVESQVQKVMLESDRDARENLRDQMTEIKQGNAKKKALHEAEKTRGESTDKGSKAIAVAPVKPAEAVAKPKFNPRPCTPINPC